MTGLKIKNKRVENIHPIVNNHYTLVSVLPQELVIYTVSDLKNIFFSLHWPPANQPMFSFKWRDLEDVLNRQMTWTQVL